MSGCVRRAPIGATARHEARDMQYTTVKLWTAAAPQMTPPPPCSMPARYFACCVSRYLGLIRASCLQTVSGTLGSTSSTGS
jgi:hypothetical protein